MTLTARQEQIVGQLTDAVMPLFRLMPNAPVRATVMARIRAQIEIVAAENAAIRNNAPTATTNTVSSNTGQVMYVNSNAEIAAVRADEQSKCATSTAAAVAAARTSERAKCVAEIQVAPLTGVTVALAVFSASQRDQIKAYVASGPH